MNAYRIYAERKIKSLRGYADVLIFAKDVDHARKIFFHHPPNPSIVRVMCVGTNVDRKEGLASPMDELWKAGAVSEA